jgi:hypothetical protein
MRFLLLQDLSLILKREKGLSSHYDIETSGHLPGFQVEITVCRLEPLML